MIYKKVITCEKLSFGWRVSGITILMMRRTARPTDINSRCARRLERTTRRCWRGDLDDTRHSSCHCRRRCCRFPLHSNSFPGLSWITVQSHGIVWLVDSKVVGQLLAVNHGRSRLSRDRTHRDSSQERSQREREREREREKGRERERERELILG